MANSIKKVASKKPDNSSSAKGRASQRDRLSCRIDPKIKRRAEDAAILLGQDLTAFTESALDEKASAVIEREEKLVLADQDFEEFVEALNNPAPPPPELIAARRALRQLREEHPQGNW